MDKLGEQIKTVSVIREITKTVKLKEGKLCMSGDQIDRVRNVIPVVEKLKETGIFPDSLRNFEGKLEILRKHGIKI